MDKKVALKWADELESGNWFQGNGYLKYRREHEKTKHCCLGVLCEINGLKSTKNFEDIVDKTLGAFEFGDNVTHFIPESLAERLDLSYDSQEILVDMNDSGCSFTEIAAYIREKYDEL